MFCRFIFFCFWHLVGSDTDGVKIVTVMEGDSVTLHINVTDKHRIQYWTGPENTIKGIGWSDEDTYDITFYDDDDDDEIFKDRLQIDNQTGSLTIRNIRTTDSGLYQMHSLFLQRESFNVTVYGISVLSSISVSDVISSVSLHLEVENQDKNTYSCVLNNPISNQTTHLDITELCQTHPDRVHCCGFTEAVIRLVISAVVGVATVAIVVYDITSRRAEKKRRTSQSVHE